MTVQPPSGRSNLGSPRRVLVTGGSGFIGTNLVQRYLDRDVPVLSVDQRAPQDSLHRSHWTAVDVRSASGLRDVIQDFQPTHLVHLAAVTDQFGRSMHDYESNIEGVRATLSALTTYGGVRRAVFASTRLVCQSGVLPVSETDYCPPNFYGRSKVIGEQIVRAHNHPGEWVIVRPTSIWGPWGEEPYRPFFVTLARGRYVHPAGQTARKHYGFVGNTVYQIDRLLQAPSERVQGRTFYLADYEPTEVRAFARLIRRRMGLTPPREVPLAALRAIALVGDAVQATGRVKRFPLNSDRLSNLCTDMLFDLQDLSGIVGPLPFSLQQAVDVTIRHLREHGHIAAAQQP